MKIKVLILPMLMLVSSCASNPVILKIKDDHGSYTLRKCHIESVARKQNVADKSVLSVRLTGKGSKKLKKITENNIGKTISVYYRDTALMKNIMVRDAIDSMDFILTINNPKTADQIVNQIRK